MGAVASEPLAGLSSLVELFRGACDDSGEWIVTPCYSPVLGEQIAAHIGPESNIALIRAVMYDGSEFGPVTREVVGDEPWDALTVGWQRWSMSGKPRL